MSTNVRFNDYRYISLIVDQILEAVKFCRWTIRRERPLGFVGIVARLPEFGSSIVIVWSSFA